MLHHIVDTCNTDDTYQGEKCEAIIVRMMFEPTPGEEVGGCVSRLACYVVRGLPTLYGVAALSLSSIMHEDELNIVAGTLRKALLRPVVINARVYHWWV